MLRALWDVLLALVQELSNIDIYSLNYEILRCKTVKGWGCFVLCPLALILCVP